jgi:hypothetical protein
MTIMQVANYFSRAEAEFDLARLEAAGIRGYIYDLEKRSGRFELWIFDETQWSAALLLLNAHDGPPFFNPDDYE